ncbi:MAG: hypothetical protein CXT78_10030 [Thaumarchaeota archaeon]|jgi:hypothetical protein|nr:MAG: hypothetical protein CXT78_10030 [Nitrososphaerota archaeon]
MTGTHFDNTYFHFFMDALQRNENLQVINFPTENSFDASILKNKFDVVLLWSNNWFGMPEEIIGIKDLEIPVVARAADPGDQNDAIKNHKKLKINYYFHFMPESYFHELYDNNFKFKTIVYGLESSLYQNLKSFDERKKNRILNTGACGSNKITNKIYWFLKDRTVDNPYIGYKLRTMVNKLSYVDYTTTLQHEYVNDKFPKLLEKYQCVIAACSDTPTINFWEKPAAGCLTFMEITKKNRGKYLGFVDGETAIFINENNYKDKLQEFLNDPNNHKWKKIASQGKEYTLKNLNNDKAVESLVEIFKGLV